MESPPDKDQQPAPTPYGDDLGSEDTVSPNPIPTAAESSRRPWLLQDWIALTVAGCLSGLFIVTTWTTCRDWPVVKKEIEKARAKIAEIEGAVGDPSALKRKLEQTLQKANGEISEIRKAISRLDQDRAEHAARKASLDLDKAQKKEAVQDGTVTLNRAFTSARLKVKAKASEVDFDVLLKNGPGREPDPKGPNFVYSEWRSWKARKEAYDIIGSLVGGPVNDLRAMKGKLRKVEGALDLAAFAFEKAQKSIESNTIKLNQKLEERSAVERMLATSLVEADQFAVRKVEKSRRALRNSEAVLTALWLQNIPTVVTLFLVSVSALVRLALLRGLFKPRTLIPS